jgi:hypothetical protein
VPTVDIKEKTQDSKSKDDDLKVDIKPQQIDMKVVIKVETRELSKRNILLF